MSRSRGHMPQDESGNPLRKTGEGTNRVIQLPGVLPSQSHKSVILVADDEALARISHRARLAETSIPWGST